jgi:beta-ketoacyl-acyl-carrier-protein synthase II
MKKRRVVITGLGTINPLGNTPDKTWERVKNGQSGVVRLTKIDTTDLKTDFGGEVNDFDAMEMFGRKDARRMDPVTQFGMAAAIWAMADAGIQVTDANRDQIGVVLGCGMGNFASLLEGYETAKSKGYSRVSPFYVPMLLADAPAANISIQLGLRGPNMAIATACAAGNNAIGEAAKMIERGAADVMLAGGAEAPLLPIIIAGFNAAGALATYDGNPEEANCPFDLNRRGFVTGEGAAILVLEEREQAVARGAHIYGEFLGYGTSADAYHLSAPPDDGGGAAVAIRKAVEDAGISPTDISYINAHGTGTVLNDKAETAALKTVLGEHVYNIPISSTKPIHSHLLGAAGALEAVVCLKAMAANIAPPTINYETPDPDCDLNYVPNTAQPTEMNIVMSNGFGLGGHNATIILGKG